LTKRTPISDFAANLRENSYFLHPRKLNLPQTRTDILSGLTVALALVPEAVAFAFVAGVDPIVGLYAAFIVGLITAAFGGRPGMISGATGALAVVMVSLVAQHGLQYLFATVVLMGILQILAGVFRLGKFIRMVPHPVMLGFVNGLAIVIFLAQMEQFKVPGSNGHHVWMSGMTLWITLALVAATMAIIWITPRITRAFPAPLAAIGLIESLLTLNLVGEITNQRGGASKECLAQGAANTVTGFFGGMGGCAMIGQSMINVNSGGRGRLSGISAALFLLAFILVGSSIIELIPLAALVGVMFMVVIGTFAWQSIKLMSRVPFADAFVIILVTIVTVYKDLAIAVVVGVIVSALVYAWNAASRISATSHPSKSEPGARVYDIEGPLFFGSATRFQELFTPTDDPDTVILDFASSRVVDQSALQAIEAIAEKYDAAGKRLMLRHLSQDCHQLLNKAGQLMVDADDDPNYRLSVDYDIQLGRFGGH
jgi:SulP family sulfate permease